MKAKCIKTDHFKIMNVGETYEVYEKGRCWMVIIPTRKRHLSIGKHFFSRHMEWCNN